MDDPQTKDIKPEIDEEEKEIEQKMIKVISMMPKEVQNRFKVLKVLSDRRSKLNDQFEEEVKALEAKFAAQKKPLYETRKQIVLGEVTDFKQYSEQFDQTHAKLEETCKDIVTKTADGEKKDTEIKPVDVENLKGVNGIPDFWYRAIKNNQMIFEIVKEKDEEILKHLRHIDSERTQNPKTLKVTLYFNDNEFFDNKELSLKVYYKGENDEVEKIEGTVINWKEGKDVTKKKIKKKQKHKKTNETRTIVKTVDAESLFNVFQSRAQPDENANLESDEENELQDKIDVAMNFAEDVEDVLIPDALEYYLGLNDDLFDQDEDDMDDDDDEEGAEDQDSGDEGNDKKKGGKKKGGKGDKKGGDAAGAAGGQQQECKQQ